MHCMARQSTTFCKRLASLLAQSGNNRTTQHSAGCAAASPFHCYAPPYNVFAAPAPPLAMLSSPSPRWLSECRGTASHMLIDFTQYPFFVSSLYVLHLYIFQFFIVKEKNFKINNNLYNRYAYTSTVSLAVRVRIFCTLGCTRTPVLFYRQYAQTIRQYAYTFSAPKAVRVHFSVL